MLRLKTHTENNYDNHDHKRRYNYIIFFYAFKLELAFILHLDNLFISYCTF